MATTVTFSILGAGTVPDNTAAVFIQPWSIPSTASIGKPMVVTFTDSTAKSSLHGEFAVPNNYTNSTQNAFLVFWMSTVTSGNRVWFVDYRAVAATESYASTSWQQSTSVTSATSTAVRRVVQATRSVSSGNFAANDVVQWALSVNGASTADTLSARSHVADVLFRCQVTT